MRVNGYDYFLALRRLRKANKTVEPVPNRSSDAGSGTAAMLVKFASNVHEVRPSDVLFDGQSRFCPDASRAYAVWNVRSVKVVENPPL